MHTTSHFRPIGTINTPHKTTTGMPIQPSGCRTVEGSITMLPEYTEGLKDLNGFSHIILIYHFHKNTGYSLSVTPFLDDAEHGVFATRAPRRPNAIGLSIVELLTIDNDTLFVRGVDILDGTPLLDIKPYVPAFDSPENSNSAIRTGWLEHTAEGVSSALSDERFSE